MKLEDVSQKNQLLRDRVSHSTAAIHVDEDSWNALVLECRDNTELEAFLRFLVRHLPNQELN